MNQEQFADCLGTTVLSINRWENGKTEPNKMAQKQLYQFCKDNGVDLAKMIIESKTYENTDNKLILYHGSKTGIVGDIAPISRGECDFGHGFYMGTSTLQSLTYCLRRCLSPDDFFVCLPQRVDFIDTLKRKIKDFPFLFIL